MTKERELLRRALDAWDFTDSPYFEEINSVMVEIHAYLKNNPKDDADVPGNGWHLNESRR